MGHGGQARRSTTTRPFTSPFKIASPSAGRSASVAGKIIAFDIYENEDVKNMGVEYKKLAHVLQQADVISLHCPLTGDTQHIIDRMTLRTMKKNAIILNTARGGLIDTDDLIEALENGSIAGAALDVYENESGLFFTNRSDLSMDDRILHWDRNMVRLANLPNTIISPHVAFLTGEALDNICKTTLDNLICAFDNDDSVCGTVGTQKWIWDLGYPVKSLWKVWEVNQQVAGYITHFITPHSTKSRLIFATVHFAGHEVPTYKPQEAFELFQAYLNDDL